MKNRNYSEHPYLDPNLKITLTPTNQGERLSKNLGYAAFGIFKALEAKKEIDLEYLVHFNKSGIDGPINELLIIYTMLFGHNKSFDVSGYDPETFGDIVLRAIHSKGGGIYIHNHLCRMGYYDDQE